MPNLTTSENTTSLGRISTTEEEHVAGSRTQVTDASEVTRTVATPETEVLSRAPIHVGVNFRFTLKFRGNKS